MKKQFFLIILIFISFLKCFSQNTEWESSNFSSKNEFNTAYSEFKQGNQLFEKGDGFYNLALGHYKKAYEFNPNNAELNYRMGLCIISSFHKEQSVTYFEKAYRLDSTLSEDLIFDLAYSHQLNEDWDIAISWYKKYEDYIYTLKLDSLTEKEYIDVFEKSIYECRNGKKFSRNPARVKIENLGETINSKYPEYGVLLKGDNSRIYFTSRRPGSTGHKYLKQSDIDKEKAVFEFPEDIYYSKANGSKRWTYPQRMSKPVNSKYHDATVALSFDGSSMIIYRAQKYSGGLFESHLTGDQWSDPYELRELSSGFHESSATYGLNKNTIFYVSNKPEDNIGLEIVEYGEKTHDIFFVSYDPVNERWLSPQNLGTKINTKYNERDVFLHPDGKTLFFSSDGHNSMGGYDIFKSIFNDKTGEWSEPINLGYPINGPSDDRGFTLSSDGKIGYFSSEKRDGYGDQDIYAIYFYGQEKESLMMSDDRLLAYNQTSFDQKTSKKKVNTRTHTTVLTGTILNDKKEPIGGTIHLTDNETHSEVAIFTANSITGKFLVSLPPGKNYGIAVESEGYLFHSENFVIPSTNNVDKIERTIQLNPKSSGSKVVLNNVFFSSGKSVLKRESKTELQRLLQFLNENPSIKIEISGFTDNVGTPSSNLKLSNERALAVKNYLIKRGIGKGRLIAKGYGEKQPIAENKTEDGRQKNRRTEFKIL